MSTGRTFRLGHLVREHGRWWWYGRRNNYTLDHGRAVKQPRENW